MPSNAPQCQRVLPVVLWERAAAGASASVKLKRWVVGAVGEIVSAELPLLALFYTVEYIAVRKGVKAFQEDHEGGFTSGNYATYARNVHPELVTRNP